MDWSQHVRKIFDSYIDSRSDIDLELKKTLKHNERLSPFLSMLSEEVSKAERLVHKRRGTPLKMDTINWLIEDMSRLLIRGIQLEADRRVESYIKKLQRKQELDYVKDLDETSEGRPSGVFEDLDIISGDTIVTNEKRSESIVSDE